MMIDIFDETDPERIRFASIASSPSSAHPIRRSARIAEMSPDEYDRFEHAKRAKFKKSAMLKIAREVVPEKFAIADPATVAIAGLVRSRAVPCQATCHAMP